VDAVACVLAVQELASRYDWFTPSVRDIRMLRIEENNNLMPAVERGNNREKSP
jgi:virulence-associated protein VapD